MTSLAGRACQHLLYLHVDVATILSNSFPNLRPFLTTLTTSVTASILSCASEPLLPKGGDSVMAQHLDLRHANFDVDYVIVYRFTDTSMLLVRVQTRLANPSVSGKADAREGFARLLEALATVGLQIEVRNGDNCSLLVLVKVASDRVLNHHIHKSR